MASGRGRRAARSAVAVSARGRQAKRGQCAARSLSVKAPEARIRSRLREPVSVLRHASQAHTRETVAGANGCDKKLRKRERNQGAKGGRAVGPRATPSAPALPRVLRRQGLTGAPGPGARKPGDRRRGDGSLPRRRSPVQRAGLRVVRRPAQPGPGRPGGRLERLVSLTRSRRHADAVSATARHSDFQVLGVALTFPSASAPPASQRHLPPARPVRSPCALPVSPREVSPFLDGAPRTRQSSGKQPPVLGTPFLPSSGGGSRGGSRPQRTCRHP